MIGFDIGGTKCAVCIGEEIDGRLIIQNRQVIPTDHTVSPYVMLDRMWQLARKLTEETGCIGISCGGPLDSRHGLILSPPNLPGWDHVEVVEYLKERSQGEVFLQNDANACAIAEWKYGAGKGFQNIIFLTFGTGMGAGLILNGQPYSGSSDMAGEIGHVRLSRFGPVGYGKAGSFEGFCSGSGIAQIGQMAAREKLQMGMPVSFCNSLEQLDQITAKTVAECANKGYEDALNVYRLCGEMLGRGLSILIDILNPECIILGSIFQRCEHLLRESMEQTIARESLSSSAHVCRIVPSALADQIGDYAALAVAAIEQEGIQALQEGGKNVIR